jgi:iron-sulfur cluster assembly protein
MEAALEPVQISPEAAREVSKIMSGKDIPEGYGLRIGVRGGKGCFGVSYYLGFDKKKSGDLEYTVQDFPVYVSKAETMYLLGVVLDFYEGSDARGFTFSKES